MDHALHARNLLDLIRESPMLRPKPREALEPIRDHIESTLWGMSVLAPLAHCVANQLVNKIVVKSLGSERTWRALGTQLLQETERLRSGLRFVDRQIAVVLPKASPSTVEQLHAWLKREEPSIARTILNAAISAKVPHETAERYLGEYRRVEDFVRKRDPRIARTFANATFMAEDPIAQATLFLERFKELEAEYRGTDVPARTLARAVCRTTQPKVAARQFANERYIIVKRLTSQGAEVTVARTISDVACLSADPVARADALLAKFNQALKYCMARAHRAARTIALSACRWEDPIAAAQRYMNAYDEVLEVVNRQEKRYAHEIASSAFRSPEPLQTARRLLSAYQRKGTMGLDAGERGTSSLGGFPAPMTPPTRRAELHRIDGTVGVQPDRG